MQMAWASNIFYIGAGALASHILCIYSDAIGQQYFMH
jgi:hypothetical protein